MSKGFPENTLHNGRPFQSVVTSSQDKNVAALPRNNKMSRDGKAEKPNPVAARPSFKALFGK